jgi:L-ascorbate 6-phosphate lactonase
MEDIRSLRLREDELALFFLGQNTFIIKTPNRTLIALDPYLSRNPNWPYIHPEPPIRPKEVRVDFVFCTHDHIDHTDPATLQLIAEHSPKTVFLGPRESYNRYLATGIAPDRTQCLASGAALPLADFTVTALHSIPPSREVTTHFGYLFDFGFVKLYNMGDSSPNVVEHPLSILDEAARSSPEIAILPIVGDFPTRKPEDAFLFASILKPRVVIPCHYGCFTDRTVDPRAFVELFDDASAIRPVVIDYKGVYTYPAPEKAHRG